MVALDKWYQDLMIPLEKTFINAYNLLLDQLKHGIQILKKGQTLGLILLLRNPFFINIDILKQLIPKISFILATLTQPQRIEFAWSLQESLVKSDQEVQGIAHMFRQLVDLFNRFITIRILSNNGDESIYYDENLIWAIQTLAVFCNFIHGFMILYFIF